MERTEIDARGMTFEAWAAGPADGELVLLLHGFPQTGWCYRHQIEALAAAGFRAVAPDQRGYSPGARPTGPDDYVISELVADVVGIVDALGGGPIHLVGHDWGGAVAWQVAGHHPELLRTLSVLSMPHPEAFGAALGGALGGDQTTRSGYVGFLQSDRAESVLLADDAAVLRAVYTAGDGRALEAGPYVSALQEPGALTAALAWYRNIRAHEGPTSPIGPVEVPTLYVWSDRDTALGREAAEATGDHVRGPYRFEVLSGVSHWVTDEAPDQVTAILLAHLHP